MKILPSQLESTNTSHAALFIQYVLTMRRTLFMETFLLQGFTKEKNNLDEKLHKSNNKLIRALHK